MGAAAAQQLFLNFFTSEYKLLLSHIKSSLGGETIYPSIIIFKPWKREVLLLPQDSNVCTIEWTVHVSE